MREVADLAVSEIQPTENGGGFRSVSEWTALATAGHWGHAHARRLRFRALIEVEPLDGIWRLGGITVLDIRDAG